MKKHCCKKVYCKNCKWLYVLISMYEIGLRDKCDYPTNSKLEDKYDSIHRYYKWYPEEKNKKNNCPLYEEREKRGLLKRLFNL